MFSQVWSRKPKESPLESLHNFHNVNLIKFSCCLSLKRRRKIFWFLLESQKVFSFFLSNLKSKNFLMKRHSLEWLRNEKETFSKMKKFSLFSVHKLFTSHYQRHILWWVSLITLLTQSCGTFSLRRDFKVAWRNSFFNKHRLVMPTLFVLKVNV
jgi:hypothetical protein